MDSLAVLEQASDVGLRVWVEGSSLKVKGQPTPQALAVVEALKERKGEVVSFLKGYGDGHRPPLDRPIATEQELRRWVDYTADPQRFAMWLEWAMRANGPAEG